jgi:hypothetical protein
MDRGRVVILIALTVLAAGPVWRSAIWLLLPPSLHASMTEQQVQRDALSLLIVLAAAALLLWL